MRTLVILVTLVCAYFGACDATTRCGNNKYVGQSGHYAFSAPGALLLVATEGGHRRSYYVAGDQRRYFYYLWLFGPAIKLPIESTRNWSSPYFPPGSGPGDGRFIPWQNLQGMKAERLN